MCVILLFMILFNHIELEVGPYCLFSFIVVALLFHQLSFNYHVLSHNYSDIYEYLQLDVSKRKIKEKLSSRDINH